MARVHVLPGLATKRDVPLLRLVDAVDHVQHRALPGAVGSDDRAHLVLAHVEAHLGERLHAAERKRHLVDLEDDVADPALDGARLELAQVHAAALACSPANVRAALTRSSARTEPTRPSSKRTWASTTQRSTPE